MSGRRPGPKDGPQVGPEIRPRIGPDAGSHHISSVAHHFLEQDGAVQTARPAARRILVGAATDDRAAAFAAAGLLAALDADSGGREASGLPGRSDRLPLLNLFESAGARWSATAYLDSSLLHAAAAVRVPDVLPAGWIEAAWRFGRAGDDAEADSRDNRFHVCQLGTVSENLLEWFELRRVVQAGGSQPALVWCLRRDEALQLTRAQALGRLLSALEPNPIEILVFPQDWDSSAGEGLLDRVRRLAGGSREPAPQLAAEVEDLFRCLLPRGEVTVSVLEGRPDGPLAGAAAGILEAAARRLAAGPSSP